MENFQSYESGKLLLLVLKRIAFWTLAWTVLFLLAVAAPTLIQIVYPSEINVKNNSDMHLRDVEIFGEGGNVKWPSMAPGQAMTGSFNLAGASVMGLKFVTPDGRVIEKWFAAAEILPQAIEVTIAPSLKILKERPIAGGQD